MKRVAATQNVTEAEVIQDLIDEILSVSQTSQQSIDNAAMDNFLDFAKN